MDRFPKKPCKYCGGRGHFPYACYKNPKHKAAAKKPLVPRAPIKRKTKLRVHGKVSKQWVLARETWIRKNPAPIQGLYWQCYLGISPDCPRLLYDPSNKPDDDQLEHSKAQPLTLDHVVSRSRDPSKRFDQSNLKPCCWWCNTLKGSRSLEQVKPGMVE
jgi:5-methylcytosine-specific restriction endonuclease McrA